MAADMLRMGKSNRSRALSALEAKGFIVSIRRSRPHRERERVASCWRLTFLPFKGNPPTRDFVRRHFKAKDMEELNREQSVRWGGQWVGGYTLKLRAPNVINGLSRKCHAGRTYKSEPAKVWRM